MNGGIKGIIGSLITIGDGAAVAALSLPGKMQTCSNMEFERTRANGCSPLHATHQAPFREVLEWIQVLLF